MAKDVLPDAHESREFKAATAKLVAEAKRGNTPQRTKFEEMARKLGVDEDEARFEDTVRKIATSERLGKAAPPKED